MHIAIDWFTSGKYPQFNVALASAEGREPFLTVKGCRIVDGSKGRFVSWPATKQDSGKYWNHVWASEAFGDAVLQAADKARPPSRRSERDDEEPPF